MENNKKQEKTDDVGGGVVYKGMADPGTPTNKRRWAIWKETTTGSDVEKQYPAGTGGVISAEEEFAWDERLTLGYADSDDVTAPTLAVVHIESDGDDPTYAKVGDTILLEWEGSEILRENTAVIAGHEVDVVEGADATLFSAEYEMVEGDAEGLITFSIGYQDIGGRPGTNVTATTDASAVTFDKTAPTIESAVRGSDTEITVSLSELAKTASITKANAGGFVVTRNGEVDTYAVSAIAPGATDDLVVLTVADISGAIAEGVTVTYVAGGNGTVADLAGNALATDEIGVNVASWAE